MSSFMDRRAFLHRAVSSAAALAVARQAAGADTTAAGPVREPRRESGAVADPPDITMIRAEIGKRHDEAVRRLQEWIRQPTIAAEDRGIAEGCDLMMRLLREAGFAQVAKIPTDRHPGVFATLDAGAPKSLGVYFMYDVKQVDPSEWSSPPFDAALVDKPGLGKVVIGRGAVNSKGPQAAFLAAVHAFRGAGRKLPVNLVFVAESEEEIGSPHFPQVVRRQEVSAALAKCMGVLVPSAAQALDGTVTMSLGAKGVVELELVSSGERWGRGPKQDLHSSNEARVDSPAWHLVQALNTLVGPDGHTPAIEGFANKARPLSATEKEMIREAAQRQSEAMTKRQLGVERWVHDVGYLESLELLESKPTVNIEGLVGGYTGPGGKTILPHRAVAKIDMRLVPDMTAQDALSALKAHLAKRGFADIEVNMTGGYDPTSTPANSTVVRAETAVYRRFDINPILWPRTAGSWPGYVFTGEPLKLAAIQFGLGHGSGAHAPNEYYVIESTNPKIQSFDGAVLSHVQYLYELAATT
jgi:acetylornithine deacetylase/succinyl-diaminopimelate desuccinylase-like protein